MRSSYITLLRFVRRSGWRAQQRSTVRIADGQPGEAAEKDGIDKLKVQAK